MKKNVLLFLLFLLASAVAHSQLASIRPDFANPGQILRTYIVAQSFSLGSPPLSYQDIYLENGIDIIYCDPAFDPMINVYQNCFPYNCDSLYADFTIPPNTPTGYYNVHVIAQWPIGPQDNIFSNGFFIGLSPSTIEGDIYFDTNQNGVHDGGDFPIQNQRALLNPAGINLYTDANGHYHGYVDTGSCSVSWVPSGTFSQTSTPLVYNHNVPPSVTGDDFGIYSSGVLYQQSVGFYTHPMRCYYRGFSAINISNSGFAPENGSVTLIHSSNLAFDPTSTGGNTISGDSVTWSYSNLQSGNQLSYNGYFFDGAQGDTVWYTYIDSVFDLSGTFRNVYSNYYPYIISCSVDPNEKEVYPVGEQAQHYTLMNEWLNYEIRFQNTGNDSAVNIIVYDTLDSHFDLSTFEVTGSSHPMNTQMTADGKVQFTFENIFLPDSNVDEPGSNGYVTYQIKAQSGIPDPTVVTNSAGIVFDFNAPVPTNTTMNTLVTVIPVKVNEVENQTGISVYPNPVEDILVIRYPLSGNVNSQLKVYDVFGKEIASSAITSNLKLQTSNWANGIYFIRITNANGEIIYNNKVVKMTK